jgi:hypothetical protein
VVAEPPAVEVVAVEGDVLSAGTSGVAAAVAEYAFVVAVVAACWPRFLEKTNKYTIFGP